MILNTKRHGRTGRDARNLLAHLNKQYRQTSRVIRIGGVPVSSADDAVKYMQVMRDASRASVACHHISISPRIRLTAEQIDNAVQRILAAMGAEDHSYILWQHAEKARANADIADEHYHLVVGHVGPDGRALKDSFSFVRLEAAARTMEVDFGEATTHSRLTNSVIKELRRIGRDDVAEMLSSPPSPPTSAMSSRTRAKAERHGIGLPEAQATVRAAWTASDGPSAFRAALAEAGFEIAAGSRRHVFIVTKNGIEIGALDRIVREKRAAVAARLQGRRNDRPTQETTQPGRSHISRSSRRASVLGEPAASSHSAGPGPERGRTGAARRDEGPAERYTDDLGETQRNPRSPRRRIAETVSILSINRDSSFRKLRRAAEAAASRTIARKSLRRRLLERAAAVSISGMAIVGLRSSARKLAAGEKLTHSEMSSLEGARMKFMKRPNGSGYKAGLLAEITPAGFDAAMFSADIHMVKKPTPGNPTGRVMMRDGGWVEFDRSRKYVKTWGQIGRAQVLARALAASMGVEVDHLARTAAVGADADALNVTKTSEDAIKAMVIWWSMRGYSATAANDGCWITAGRARILDVGDRLEIHGGLTDQAVAATILKAKAEWGGAIYLDGHFTQAEQDHLWLAAMRAGVEMQNCNPSHLIQEAWEREREASAKTARTVSAVRVEIVEAQRLLDAAKGDVEQAKKLPGNLQAFIALYLDDDQRRELAAQPIAEVVPHLKRFRELGAIELDSHKAPSEPKITFVEPETEQTRRDPDNMHTPK